MWRRGVFWELLNDSSILEQDLRNSRGAAVTEQSRT